ncbi:MAG: hypothetical protein H7311_04960 [Ramlibacter sp.]|nr:hypothetical protein [Cryobacterium sp.]
MSLLHRGGRYADWRWVNLSALAVTAVVGYGLIGSGLGWLAWQGFLLNGAGVDPRGVLATTGLGVPVALVLGLLTPLVLGIPAIRRQEHAQSTHR